MSATKMQIPAQRAAKRTVEWAGQTVAFDKHSAYKGGYDAHGDFFLCSLISKASFPVRSLEVTLLTNWRSL